MKRILIICLLNALVSFTIGAENIDEEESDTTQDVMDCQICKTELRRAILAIISLKKALKDAEKKVEQAKKIEFEKESGTTVTYDEATGLYKSATCEWKKSRISCPDGKEIKVESANYGRKDNTTCGFDTHWNTNCHAENSMKVVSKACDNTKSCDVMATNTVFGDPCKYTVKYLAIHFTCIEGTDKKKTEEEQSILRQH